MIDFTKLHLIKVGNLTLYGFDPNNNSGMYEINLKKNSYSYCLYVHINNIVCIKYINLIKLNSDEQFFLHKKYSKVRRIRKKINEYIQKYSIDRVRNRKLKKLLND